MSEFVFLNKLLLITYTNKTPDPIQGVGVNLQSPQPTGPLIPGRLPLPIHPPPWSLLQVPGPKVIWLAVTAERTFQLWPLPSGTPSVMSPAPCRVCLVSAGRACKAESLRLAFGS